MKFNGMTPLSKAQMKTITGGNGKCLIIKDKCISDIQCCSLKCAPVKKGDKEFTCQPQ